MPATNLLLRKAPAQTTAECVSRRSVFLPLQLAACHGNTAIVDRLLQQPHTEVNATAHNGESALHIAARRGHAATVRRLLRAPGVNPNIEARTNHDETPLHSAVRFNRADVVRCLLNDVRVRRRRRKYKFLVHIAAETNADTSTIKTLVEEHRFRVYIKDHADRTPLHKCAGRQSKYSEGANTMLEYLLSRDDVDPNARDCAMGTPLHYAVRSQNIERVRTMMQDLRTDVNARTKTRGLTPLIEAVERGCCATVKCLLKSKYIHLNTKTKHRLRYVQHVTALQISVLTRQSEITRILLKDERSDLNAQDEKGGTLLHYAALRADIELLELLLSDRRTMVTMETYDGFTAYDFAAESGHDDVAVMLRIAMLRTEMPQNGEWLPHVEEHARRLAQVVRTRTSLHTWFNRALVRAVALHRPLRA